MREFIDAALGFPAGIFTVALIVVIAHWILAVCGAIEHDAWEAGVPLTVAASVFIAVAWFTGIAGTVLMDRLGLGAGTGLVLLVVAVIAARAVTGALVRPLRRVFRPDDPPPSLQDFIGRTAVIRTGRVDAGFGQAEVAATDGSTAVVHSSGLLLLLSPPGYGKTTLMEYVADRLGMVLVKVNGPALGHGVTSLDPEEAPNATARREIQKINFALEAGSNTLLHLDDIQHTSPELLQKFIPLCDATRRMEGVWNGRPRTYDLRGKRFAVCMAANPYTESGARFHLPDMLANRADVRNLGDVLTGKEEAFAVSFVENALTANPVLAPLAARDLTDLDLLLRLAAGDPSARADRLTHPYAPAELERITAVLRHLLKARETVLAVNRAYIASAAQSDSARTEPPFRLQGSYRNMNRIAARVDAAMNEAELAALVEDHYTSEAQTLTGGAEAHLLRLAELRGTLTPVQADRWSVVKSSYVRARSLAGPAHHRGEQH